MNYTEKNLPASSIKTTYTTFFSYHSVYNNGPIIYKMGYKMVRGRNKRVWITYWFESYKSIP